MKKTQIVHPKITANHLTRRAIVYLRQSSMKQVHENLESQRLQYAMAEKARHFGWKDVETIDCDLGSSASAGAHRREGFDRVVSAVAQGEVGIVLSREVSRLSRTDKDWCRLLEVCQVFDTLLGDEEQIYDLSQIDDQLVLGIKGTMSVVELKVIKMRMLRGQEEKARRGELFKRLPAGYTFDADGKVVQDPDQRVREAIDLIFKKFREHWSIRQTFLWFRDNDIELPVNPARGGTKLVWRIPSQSFIRDVLINPFYAGAYVWGRRPREIVVVDGHLKRRQGRILPPEECRVFLPDHHVGYTDWETYEENQRMIRRNTVHWEQDESVASVRAGQALLTGLLRCGHCGRKLHVRYWGGTGTSARYVCKGDFDSGGQYCISFGGSLVDKRISQEILQVISPLGMEASLAVINKLSLSEDNRATALHRQLEQLEYEARRAFEQYDEVDPRNRLVAAELEGRWNIKLEQAEKIRSRLSELTNASRPGLSEEDCQKILSIGEDFENVWGSPSCAGEIKKKIARTAIKEIVVNSDDTTLHFVIHWNGGAHTELRMARPRRETVHRTSTEALDIIRKMAVRYGDDQIASVLNRLGHTTGKGKRWTQTRVKTARRNHSISGQARMKADPEILSLNQAAKYCRVSHRSIEKLVESGHLKMHQVAPRAPWEIRRSDLDAEPVRSIIEKLHHTGKIDLQGGSSADQISLFVENKGDDNARYHE